MMCVFIACFSDHVHGGEYFCKPLYIMSQCVISALSEICVLTVCLLPVWTRLMFQCLRCSKRSSYISGSLLTAQVM